MMRGGDVGAGTAERLAAMLARETVQFSRLLEALQQEQEALAGNDLAGIERGIAAKQVLVEEIGQCASDREALVVGAGFAPDPIGTEAFIHRCPAPLIESLMEAWQALQDLVRECQQTNQVNGNIMELSRRQIQRALSLLRGATPGSQLYTAAGTREGGGEPGSLAKV